MRKYIFLSMIIISVTSCYHTDDIIINYLNTINWHVQKEIKIDLGSILGVEYDSMYLFCEYTNNDIARIINNDNYKNHREIQDSHKRIILFYRGDIVYEDDFPLRNLSFYSITEKLDTFDCSYIVHYGSQYVVLNKDGYYYLIKEKESHKQYLLQIDNVTGRQYYIQL